MEPSADHHSRYSLTGITCKEITGHSLLVVVLQEVEHMLADIIRGLPFIGNRRSRTMATYYITQTVVHAHLVVEQVETGTEIVAVLLWIIDLSDKLNLRISELHLIGSPCPKGRRHHFGHVATEGIHTLLCPEEQDVGHLVPSIGNGVEMLRTPTGITIVNAVVELYRLIPVIARGTIGKTIIARSLCGILPVGLFRTELGQVKRLSPAIVEVILR